jgi:hypothetical protein
VRPGASSQRNAIADIDAGIALAPSSEPMKRTFVIIPVLAMSLTALAGKEERDLMTKEVAPAVKQAETTYRAACGCPLAITVTSSLKTMDELRQAKYLAESITEEAPKYCTDAASKKAMCQLKSLDVVKANESKFVFSNGKGTSFTDGQSYTGWEMITREIDK